MVFLRWSFLLLQMLLSQSSDLFLQIVHQHYLLICVWLIPFIIKASRLTPVVTNGRISFFNDWIRSHCIYITIIFLSIYPSMNTLFLNLGCLTALGRANISRSWFSFLWVYTQKWDYWIIHSTISWGNFTLFCIMAVPPPEHTTRDSLCSTSSPTHVICCLFDDNHPDRCELKSHRGSDLHFLVHSLLDQGSNGFILELLWLQMSHSSKLPTYPCLWTPVPSSPDVTVLIGSQNIYEL